MSGAPRAAARGARDPVLPGPTLDELRVLLAGPGALGAADRSYDVLRAATAPALDPARRAHRAHRTHGTGRTHRTDCADRTRRTRRTDRTGRTDVARRTRRACGAD